MNNSRPHGLRHRFVGQTTDLTGADFVDTRSGVNVANFRALIARGANCTTSYQLRRTNVLAHESGYWSEDFTNFGTPFTGSASGNFGAFPSFVDATIYAPASASNSAKALFVSRARNRMTQLQAGVVGAELHKTAAQVRRPALAIQESVREHHDNVKKRLMNAARSIKFGGKAYSQPYVYDKLRRVVQSSYLEWEFGVKPTVSDVVNGAKAASRIVNGFSPSEYVNSPQEWSVVNPPPWTKSTTFKGLSLGLGSVQFDVTASASGKIRYCGAIRASVLADTSSILGLNLPNFVPSLWEWLPYSWLVDYFTNVDDILDALTFPTASMSWDCFSHRAVFKLTSIGAISPTANNGAAYQMKRRQGKNAVTVIEYITYTRGPIGSFGLIPSVQFSVPDFGQSLNIGAVVLQRAGAIKYVTKLINTIFN